jgi:hypothetical protein
MEPRNRCQGINSVSLCSLAGRYDNPIPSRCLAPIEFLKIPALVPVGLFCHSCFNFWSVSTVRTVHTVCGGGGQTNFLNDIGRNSLLGNRKKIAKFLMRTFTCRSTFLYDSNWRSRRDGGFREGGIQMDRLYIDRTGDGEIEEGGCE